MHVSVYSADLGFYVGSENNPAFSTQGPIKIDGYTYVGSDTIPSPGDYRFRIELNLQNFGDTATVENIDVKFIPIDGNYLAASTIGTITYSDIAPGESIAKRLYLRVDEACPVNSEQSIALQIRSMERSFGVTHLESLFMKKLRQ